METLKKIKKNQLPNMIDFDKLDGKTLFPEKVEMANKLLKKIKLPDFTKYQ